MAFNKDEVWHTLRPMLGKKSDHAWNPPPAIITRKKPKHFVYLGSVLACDEEAWNRLKPAVEPEAEGLLVHVGDQNYYIINVFNTVDCLDEKRSTIVYSPFDGSIIAITRYSFVTDELDDRYLFRIPQDKDHVFATDNFKELVERNNLKNIEFQNPNPFDHFRHKTVLNEEA